MSTFARRTRISRSPLPLVALLLLSVQAAADSASEPTQNGVADCAESVAAAVQARYDSIRDLSARFEQSTISVTLGGSTLGGAEVSRGRVVIAKPGKMRWSYEEPAQSLVVSDGSNLWLYDPGAREVQHLRVESGYLAGAALQFLMGAGRLTDTFRITARSCSGEVAELDLVPKSPATYERLGLRALIRTGEIRETTIVDLFGNTTRIALRELRTNTDPDPAVFDFEAPPGVDVLEIDAPR